MSRWLAILPLAALVGLGLMFWLYALGRDPHVQPHALVGKPMPALTLPSLDDGRPAALAELAADGPVLVNFFASWCAPCQVEHPVLMELERRKVRVIGVGYRDAPENTKAFLNRLGDPFAARLVDREGRAGIDFGITGVPETYLVGEDGVIVAKHTGPMSLAEAEALLAQAR